MLCKIRQRFINFIDDQSKATSEAFYFASFLEKGLKVLTPTQIFQRLSVAPARVKTENTPRNY